MGTAAKAAALLLLLTSAMNDDDAVAVFLEATAVAVAVERASTAENTAANSAKCTSTQCKYRYYLVWQCIK